MKNIVASALFAGLLALVASPAAATPLTFHFDVATAVLTPAGGPYYLDFQLIGAAGNTVTVTDFSFGGGSAGPGAPNTFGSASGSLASSVNLTDSTASFFNEFFQEFTPGSILSFNVLLTALGPAPSFSPDAFSFSILGPTTFEIPTTDPSTANKLVTIDITPTIRFADVKTFASTAPTGVVVTATPVPEPASFVLLAVGLVGFGARRFRRARQ